MNAPAVANPTPAGMTVAEAPLSQFAPSLTNPKNRHDQEHLQAMAATIKAPGRVLQPITARPWPASRGKAPAGVLMEIVIGEGRWRASELAGRDTIPFFWVEASDEQALVMQLAENIQRQALTPLQEADGFRRLMKDHAYSADQVADKFEISRSQVYGRLKLLDLCPAALKIAEQHNLHHSLVLLAARIPDEKLQIAAVKKMTPQWDDGEVMSHRRAKELVQREYMLKLDEAPFSRADDTLVPGTGRCHDCPKRTGNAADLFADIKSPDTCTDPGCYHAKAEAHIKKQKAQAKLDGIKVLEGAEAKKVKPNSWGDELAGGLVDLDATVWAKGKNQSIRTLLGKDAPKPEVLIVDPHEKCHTIEAVSRATIAEQLKAKGITPPAQVAGRQAKSESEKEAERKVKRNALWRQRLWESIRGKLAVSFDTRTDDSVLDQREFRMVAEAFYCRLQFEDQKRLARLWIGPDGKASDHQLVEQLEKRIPAMTRPEAARLMLECALAGEVVQPNYNTGKPENMLATAQALAIDSDALMAELIAADREKVAAEKAKAKAKAAPKVQPAAAKAQPETALPANEPLAIGDMVRVNDNATAPLGAKFIGKQGEVTSLIGNAFMVTFKSGTSGAKTNSTSYVRAELDKLPPLREKPASTPSNAAQAKAKGAPPAAPAKAQSTAKKPAAKTAKAKADPAPAKPANEAAAPPKTDAPKPASMSNPVAAWPFPTGANP